jgi:cytosine/adenosine deaminase-related metal-dependent hydrolase
MGVEKELGAIQVGKLADLVLLDRDPLLNISNTKAIAAVVADGNLYDRAALDAMLQRVDNSMDEEVKKFARRLD